MTREPAAADEELSLADGLDRMTANNIRHLLVARETHLVGVVSTRDIKLAAEMAGNKAAKTPLKVAMTEHPFTCDASTPLEVVAKQMEEHRYGCVVVTEGKAVAGIFTTTDALWALRRVIAGEDVPRVTKPTHIVEQPAEREKVEHRVHLGNLMGTSHTSPTPNQGTIR